MLGQTFPHDGQRVFVTTVDATTATVEPVARRHRGPDSVARDSPHAKPGNLPSLHRRRPPEFHYAHILLVQSDSDRQA